MATRRRPSRESTSRSESTTSATPTRPGSSPGGSDLKSVMDRMGHAQITTTQKYLHTLPDADHKNLTALDRIRKPAPGSPPEPAD